MIRTAESVSPNHPDKLCDRISDAILDACLEQDPMARVAMETMGGHGIITVTGELTTTAFVDVRKIVNLIAPGCGVQVNIVQQSPGISQSVDRGGAGDQGIMVGYACDETPELMPRELMLARSLCKFIYEKYPYDGKTQVTVDDEGGEIEITSVVASFQNVSESDLNARITEWYIENDLFPKSPMSGITVETLANPAGDWWQGGFDADTGLTGRKLMVDNYGPRVPIGGGAFSGKDATKVDRSAAYMARHLAVYYLQKCKAKEVFVYLAYAIGRAEPLQATVIIDGQECPVESMHNLTPKGIIEKLKLREPQFEMTARWGHFGNGFIWDK